MKFEYSKENSNRVKAKFYATSCLKSKLEWIFNLEQLGGRAEKRDLRKKLFLQNKKTHPLSKSATKKQTSTYSAYQLAIKNAMFPGQRVCHYLLWTMNFSK